MTTIIKKTPKTWRYDLYRAGFGSGWAIIFIDENGLFSTVSDYGNYGHWWSAHGQDDARKFFLHSRQDPSYFMGKLHGSRPEEEDLPATYKLVCKHILEHRRGGDWTRKRAREEWDLAKEHLDSDEDYRGWYEATSIDCAYDYHCTRYPGQLQAFIERVMPRLVTLIEAQLAAEAADPTATRVEHKEGVAYVVAA